MRKILHSSGRSVAFIAALLATFQTFAQNVTLQLSPAALGVNETSEHATVSILRSGDTNAVVEVSFTTVEGTAKATNDFVANAGTVTFAAGETNKTVSIDLVDDFENETDEQFEIQFSAPADVSWTGESKA